MNTQRTRKIMIGALVALLLSGWLWPGVNAVQAGGRTGAKQQVGEPFTTPAIAAGNFHSLALKSDGTVIAWGWNVFGQTNVPANLSGVVAIAAGGNHSLALKSDGTIVGWGLNSAGQATGGANLSGVVAIAAGGDNSLALKSDGTVVGWGDNFFGQTNVPENLSGVIAIAAGDSHSLALKSDGTIVGWGNNSAGQATGGANLSGVVAIAARGNHSLALKSDGTVVAWGGNGYGQTNVPAALTVGRNEVLGWGRSSEGQTTIPAMSGVVAIAAGGFHSLALKNDGKVVGWGWNQFGQATVPNGLSDVVALAAGSAHSLALKSDGSVVGWGLNDSGRATAPSGLSGVVALAAGFNHSLALKSDGKVVAWGRNDFQELNLPSDLSGIVAIAAGGVHSLALKSDGTIVGWGNNSAGQATVPANLSGVVALAAGSFHNLALKSDGTVVAWGRNNEGQATVPANLSGIVAIAAGDAHSLALKSDGTVVAWGSNGNGETNIPANLRGVVAVAAGFSHSLALVVGNANTPPTIQAQSLTARIAGTSASAVALASVSDAQDGPADLTVSATLVPNSGSGVTLDALQVDASGNLTATITTTCTATTSQFTLQVTDRGGLSSSTSLTVPVNANQSPTLSYPGNPGTTYGTGLTIQPLTGPSDDVGVTNVAIQSIAPTNPGGITVNSAGVVTVASNVPAGNYTVTIRATAACGFTDASFPLGIVKVTPVITWANPADITYGTALSATQLNASTNVAGSFVYSPVSGTVLNAGSNQTLSVTFTPSDTNNFNAVTRTVALNVLKAPLTVTVNNAWRNQGAANPPFSGTLTGLRNGDNITASYSTTAITSSPAGPYPITATLLDPNSRLSNYTVTNTPGTLTVLASCAASIVPLTLPPAALAQTYAAGLTVVALNSGVAGAYTFTHVAGQLPPGITLVNTAGVFSLQGVPTTPGTYTFTLLATRNAGGCSRAVTYTLTIVPTVVPIAECIINHGNGTFTARFGYDNTTGGVVTIPVGLNNTFSVGAANRNQPTVFQVGRVTNAFTVTFQANGSDASSWLLKGPDNVLRGVILNATSPVCP